MYISNLSFNTGENELRDLFEAFGSVSAATVITDRETGRSRGFGFITMDAGTEADAAMQGLNNKEVDGRPISVSVAKEKTSGSGNRR